MSLHLCSIASGSNGNCYYVANEHEAVLVDVGISCKELEKRMERQGLSMDKVKAIFISHEHTDHIYGLPSVLKKYPRPVYLTTPTLAQSRLSVNKHQFYSITTEPVFVGDLQITSFAKIHDAADPVSFVVSHRGVNVGVFTDIGYACQRVTSYFSQCHAVVLESNYDRELLAKGSYPWHLKKRISGGKGHLSNEQALDVFLTHRSSHLTHLLLGHLSKNNNSPQVVSDLFCDHCADVKLVIASREMETPVYHITGDSKPIEISRSVQQGVLQFG